jgi:hypothetical protein
MFRWYQGAERCYVYLSDVASDTALMMKSRWFTRGWTLQELIAPSFVEFFTKEWERLGDKQSLELALNAITGIAVEALRGTCPLSQFSIDERMSWAKGRETKREEDKAYSLLGLFGICMPLLYGEGQVRAFSRLHKEIQEASKSTPLRLDQHLTIRRQSTDHHFQPYWHNIATTDSQPPSRAQVFSPACTDNKRKKGEMNEELVKEMIASLHFKQRDARLWTIKAAQTQT